MFLPTHADLLHWRDDELPIEPWEPEALKHEQWPPDYRAVYAWRLQQLELLKNPGMLASAKAYYANHPSEFIMHWMDTYNPRKRFDKWMPFVFFHRQREFIDFLHELRNDGENGLVEKCRDAGATWLACGYSIWSWLFIDDDAIGWGSRKQDLVDKLGDPDSIFHKMRLILETLPPCFLPTGFSIDKHATFMRIINPENGSIISGEAGDNIGRGGRKSIYFKDESAHYPRAELIEAALGNNTNCQVDISSVNGPGNIFHNRREAGIDWKPGGTYERGFVRVFVIDWRDHPEKTEDWYNVAKAKHVREGLEHLFAQEVERNYFGAVQNNIIKIEWLKAAIDAHLKYGHVDDWLGPWSGALDVADTDNGTNDRNAFAKRQGLVLRNLKEWGERDPGVSTRNIIAECQQHSGIKLQYDCIGLGVAVKSEFNRLVDEKVINPDAIAMVPWNAGAGVVDPAYHLIKDDEKTPTNGEYFENMKAQAWWSFRTRLYKTWQAIVHGVIYPIDELVSIDSACDLLRTLEKEIVQPVAKRSSKLKMLIDKRPDGVKSPNVADVVIMAYFPVPEHYAIAAQGVYGNV